MMTITRKAFRGVADMPRILELVRAMPLACPHVVDLPWRLSSPAIAEGHDAAYWETDDGHVIGFAAWQYYWAALDFFLLPGAAGPARAAAESDLFAWAEGRFRERDAERGYPLPYAVEFRDDDVERRRVAEAHGFLSQDDDAGYVLLQHALVALPTVPDLPEGFALRSLRGEEEAPAYAALHRAAFESDSMTPEWRARTLRTPHYRPELDLVISAPDGTLAAFCVGWFEPARRVGQIEPIGVHPRFQRRGLGRVLLAEILHRFAQHGAERAMVQTNLGREPARRAYEAAGFEQTHVIRRREKWASQTK